MKNTVSGEPEKKENRPQPVVDPYSRHDPIPVPDAQESESESVWAMFEDAAQGASTRTLPTEFAVTQVAPLLPDFQWPTRISSKAHDARDKSAESPDTSHADFEQSTVRSPLRDLPGASERDPDATLPLPRRRGPERRGGRE